MYLGGCFGRVVARESLRDTLADGVERRQSGREFFVCLMISDDRVEFVGGGTFPPGDSFP